MYFFVASVAPFVRVVLWVLLPQVCSHTLSFSLSTRVSLSLLCLSLHSFSHETIPAHPAGNESLHEYEIIKKHVLADTEDVED